AVGPTLARLSGRARGGQVTVASEPGRGSRFRMTVTVDEVAQGPAASDGAVAPDAPVRPVAVLCVEDNPHGRVLLNTILTELGHRADFVGTGAAGGEAGARGRHYVSVGDVPR